MRSIKTAKEIKLQSQMYPGCLSCLACLVTQSCLTLGGPLECSPGSSVHGIFQARILEWVAISCSRVSSQPRDGTHISWSPAWQADSLSTEPSRKPMWSSCLYFFSSASFCVGHTCRSVFFLCDSSNRSGLVSSSFSNLEGKDFIQQESQGCLRCSGLDPMCIQSLMASPGGEDISAHPNLMDWELRFPPKKTEVSLAKTPGNGC